MPRAKPFTRKEKKQLAKAAHAQGNIQEFPGAPIWNDWLRQQSEARKREIGLPRRIGRSVLEVAAVSVVFAKALQRDITDERYKNNVRKAERLQHVVDRAISAETLSSTDLRTVEMSRLRRLGHGVMGVLNRSNERSLNRTAQKVEDLGQKSKANHEAKAGSIESWAKRKLSHIDTKRRDKHLSRQKQFKNEKDAAWAKYLKENPEVQKRLIAEQKQLDSQIEVNTRHRLVSRMRVNASFATEYFAGGNSYSFSKALPRRPEFEGSYDDLAKSSIERAAKNRNEDGSISLFGSDILTSIVHDRLPLSPEDFRRDRPSINDGQPRYTSQDFYDNAQLLNQEVSGRCDYVGGIATSLWKMGFVEFDSERDITSGNGHRMNPAIEWSHGDDGATLASLPYNHENELHRIIGGEKSNDPTNARIQLVINTSEPYAPQMSVSLVRQPALAYSA